MNLMSIFRDTTHSDTITKIKKGYEKLFRSFVIVSMAFCLGDARNARSIVKLINHLLDMEALKCVTRIIMFMK